MPEVKGEFSIDEALNIFKKGCKPRDLHKIGIEFERLTVSNTNFRAVGYDKNDGGVYDLLRAFAKLDGWDFVTDDYSIIGLQKGEDVISLEPGSQLELSFAPRKNIIEIKEKIEAFNKKIKPLLTRFEINLLEYGVSPVSTYQSINIIPKKRYHIMADYLWGILSDVMMRETAGIQACCDFESEEDAIRKFRIANIISPLMTAMFANSPIRGGVETGYKTFRALSWLNTDSERCEFMSKELFDKKSGYNFKSYVDEVLETPMIYIIRNNKPVRILGEINFKEFMKFGYQDFRPTIEDFKLHSNLYFPDVRLRNFIEIRNQDCANHGMQYAVLAMYKGLLYDNNALDSVEDLMSKFSYNNIKEFRYCVPRNALNAKIGKYWAKEIASELLNIAEISLKKQNQGEDIFLNPLKELTPFGLSPADVILSNWNKNWNKDINKLIKFVSNN